MRADVLATQIAMLHRVLDDAPLAFGLPSCYRLRGTALTLQELAAAVESARPIQPLSAVEDALARGTATPTGTVLTFDDGYREHLDLVAPWLAERGVSATFYVATGLHGDGQAVAPVDAWYWLLDHAQTRVAEVPLPGGGVYRGRVDTLAGKQAWIGGVPKSAYLAASPNGQAAMVAALADALQCELPADLARRLYLCPDEWCALRALGMQVGAHSVSHPRLTQVDPDALAREVDGAVAALAPQGSPVPFAYPDGAYDDRVVDQVRAAGVSSAVTCEPGNVVPGADRLRLPRLFVTPQTVNRWPLA